MKFIPKRGSFLVKPDVPFPAPNDKMKTIVIVLESDWTGVVVGVGLPDLVDSAEQPIDNKVGDKVLVQERSVTTVDVDGYKHAIVGSYDIIATIED